MPEIGVVAENRFRREAGQDHRADDEAAGPHFEAAAHLFDGENNSGQWRVERGRHTGGSAGQDETRLPAGRQPADEEHHGRSHLHRRPFATRRCADQEAEQCEQHFADGDAQTHEPTTRRHAVQRTRCNRLRNAGALRVGKEAHREEHGGTEPQRRDHERRIEPPRHERVKQVLHRVGRNCQPDGHQPNNQPADNEDAPPLPPARMDKQDTNSTGRQEGGHVMAIGRSRGTPPLTIRSREGNAPGSHRFQ